MALMLSLTEANDATEEWSYKQGIIHLGSALCFIIVLILLRKIEVFYVKLILICFRGLSLKKILSGLLLLISSLTWLYEDFYKFCKKVFDERRNKNWGKSLWKDKSLGKSLIAVDIRSFYWALDADKLILLFHRVG